MSVDFLAPYFANAITSAHPEFVVSIDHTLVSLERGGEIEVVERGVRVGRRDREAQLNLPEVSVVFGMRAVLAGVIAPTRIIVRRPELRIDREADGKFQLGLGGANAAASDWVGDLLHHLAAPPDRKGPLGYLAQVSIRNAVLTVDDRALGVTWRARSADATLFRGESGLLGDMTLMVERPGGGETELRSDFRYAKGQGRLALQFGFSALRPALFAGSAPALAPLAAMDLPLSGQLRLELDIPAVKVSAAWCDLALGKRRFRAAALPSRPGNCAPPTIRQPAASRFSGCISISAGRTSMPPGPSTGSVAACSPAACRRPSTSLPSCS